jgi:hypothetical protein
MSKYCTVVLYAGEVAKFPLKPDCWQFDTVKQAAEFLVNRGVSPTVNAAQVGLAAVLNNRAKHFKGYTLSVAYSNLEMNGGRIVRRSTNA